MQNKNSGVEFVINEKTNDKYFPLQNNVFSVRLQTQDFTIGLNNFIKEVKKVCFINGSLEQLKAMFPPGLTSLPGKLYIKEQLTPFSSSDYDIKKSADLDKGGVVCSKNGQPIYRLVCYDATGTQEDILIQHDNKEEILAAKAKYESALATV
tara:strand:+ start:85 stop:540 length:456 start_codon:yes stop_codon:yes gene_type:complete